MLFRYSAWKGAAVLQPRIFGSGMGSYGGNHKRVREHVLAVSHKSRSALILGLCCSENDNLSTPSSSNNYSGTI